MGERHAERAAPTIDDLADRFEREHLPKKRAGTQDEYLRLLGLYIRPKLGKIPVADHRHGDIDHVRSVVSSVRSALAAALR